MGKIFLKYLRYCCLAMVVLTAGSSCDVHEWPETDFSTTDFALHLQFDTDLPLYQEIYYSRGDLSALDQDSRTSIYDHDIRHIIEVYPAGNGSKSRATASPVCSFVYNESSVVNFDRTYNVKLPEGDWDIYVFTDFVDAGSQNDKYYKTSDFSAIIYPDRGSYSGSNECRQVFRGMTSVHVEHPYRFLEDETLPNYEATVEMRRPMARYEFISTDMDEFIKLLPNISSRYRESRGNDDPAAESDGSRSLSRADIEEFKVVFRYTAYMPSQYNVFSDKPTDSWTGMTYESRMDIVDDGISLGFDYLFVNGSEAIANVACEVYNGDGEKIASTPSIEVPVLRSKNTIVKGEFLSSSSSGGVTIQPGFDGDYNIEIQ